MFRWKEQVMKRACLVVLCISISSVASAAIGFVPSKTTVAMGETINIKLIADGPCYGFTIDAATDWGKGGVASNLQPAPPGLMTILVPGYIENTPDGILFSYVGAYATSVAAPAGTTLFSFDYTADSILGLVTIEPVPPSDFWYSEWDDAWYVAGPSRGDVGGVLQDITGCTINVVPEPMTVALLGLGGILLRRRIA
jgi:hypothetical protein